MSQAVAENFPDAELLELDTAVDAVLANCDGDYRAAIRALIVANGFLEQDLEKLRASISNGYVRGRFDKLLSRGDVMASGHSGEVG